MVKEGGCMAKLSNTIEDYIIKMLKEADGMLEIQRNLLAEHFACAPSQINYVLTTRFTPYKGYYVESRRGGGGFIRIIKVGLKNEDNVFDLFNKEIGNSITQDKSYHIIDSLYELGKITSRELELVKAALSDRALDCEIDNKNVLRAGILKNMLLIIL